MIPNCAGCEEEIEEAYYWQEQGLHVATTDDFPSSYPDNRKHFTIMMVNDKGKVMVGRR